MKEELKLTPRRVDDIDRKPKVVERGKSQPIRETKESTERKEKPNAQKTIGNYLLGKNKKNLCSCQGETQERAHLVRLRWELIFLQERKQL